MAKYVDAFTYQVISEDEANARLNAYKAMPDIIRNDHSNNATDLTLCSFDHFLEVCCNVLVVH